MNTIEKSRDIDQDYCEDGLPNGFTRRQIASVISSQVQSFTLFPTEKCNFRCTYCYEDFKIGKMPPKLQRAIELLPDHAQCTDRTCTYA